MASDEATNPSLTSSQVAPQHYVLAASTTLLNAEAAAVWEQALAKASSYLINLLRDPNREALFACSGLHRRRTGGAAPPEAAAPAGCPGARPRRRC